MAQNYVVLNFTDHLKSEDKDTRTGPVNTLRDTLAKRAHLKHGTFGIHHMADIFARIRRNADSKTDPVTGMLDEGWVKTLCVKAPTDCKEEWNAMLNDVREADKIVFAAHGLP